MELAETGGTWLICYAGLSEVLVVLFMIKYNFAIPIGPNMYGIDYA